MLLQEITLKGVGIKYTFWMRTYRYLRSKGKITLPLRVVTYIFLRHYTYKFGLDIPAEAEIGSGFYVGHFGGIVVHPEARIGKNCNIAQGVTIGVSNRGKKQGVPTIGDNVFIGPGAKIFGRIRVGNNVAIGANAVVYHDIPDNAVVVGIPGHVVSQQGSAGYINQTDYDGKI